MVSHFMIGLSFFLFYLRAAARQVGFLPFFFCVHLTLSYFLSRRFVALPAIKAFLIQLFSRSSDSCCMAGLHWLHVGRYLAIVEYTQIIDSFAEQSRTNCIYSFRVRFNAVQHRIILIYYVIIQHRIKNLLPTHSTQPVLSIQDKYVVLVPAAATASTQCKNKVMQKNSRHNLLFFLMLIVWDGHQIIYFFIYWVVTKRGEREKQQQLKKERGCLFNVSPLTLVCHGIMVSGVI